MRTKGSCKFEPYYKVEKYNELICAWNPIQKVFPSKEQAEHFASTKGYTKTRVLKFTEKGVIYE